MFDLFARCSSADADEPVCAAGIDVARAGDSEYYFVSPVFESCGGAVGGRGDHLLVIFVLLLPATFFWIIRAEGNVSE